MTTASHSPRLRQRWLWCVAALATVAIIWGMWRALAHRHTQQAALTAATQQAAPVLQIPSDAWLAAADRTLDVGVPVTGALQAVDRATVKAQASGVLRGLQVREGDPVQQGQVLGQIDATETDARYRQAQLQADASQAQVSIAQRQYDNNRALVDQGFISSTALQTSAANLQAAQANHAAARAAQAVARKNLDDTVLRSPLTGQVAQRMVQNGERVNVEAPVVEVVNLAALELLAQLPLNDSAGVQLGQPASLSLEGAAEGHVFTGKVARISPSATAGSRTVPVYVLLDAPPAGTTLRPGMYVQGHIHTGTQVGMAVPLTAIRTDQPAPYVQSVHNGRVVHLPVTVGTQSMQAHTMWAAVQGLASGTPVLLSSVGGLPAGTDVALVPQQPTAPPAPAGAAAVLPRSAP